MLTFASAELCVASEDCCLLGEVDHLGPAGFKIAGMASVRCINLIDTGTDSDNASSHALLSAHGTPHARPCWDV